MANSNSTSEIIYPGPPIDEPNPGDFGFTKKDIEKLDKLVEAKCL